MTKRTKAALAHQVWVRMFGFFMRTGAERSTILARFGLTPNDARALHTLDDVRPRSMRSLADEWGCDASNATWIVDRLEKAGLAERQTTSQDRRLKLVRLTKKGVARKLELDAAFTTPPPELLSLTIGDLQALHDALNALRADDPPPGIPEAG